MANGPRPLTFLFVFAVSVVGSWFIGCSTRVPEPAPPTRVPTAGSTPPILVPPIPTPQGPYPAAGNWTLTVGPDACKVTSGAQPVPVAVISKSKSNWIRFQPNAAQPLGIVFHVEKNDPKPFKDMTPDGFDPEGNALWKLACKESGNKCFTGPAENGAHETFYKYDQILDGKPCDAWIKIEK